MASHLAAHLRRRAAAGASIVAMMTTMSTSLAAPTDPSRLGRDVTPTLETLHLMLDPEQSAYSGTATIELVVHAATDSLRFHARDMHLSKVTLRRGSTVVPTTLTRGDIGLVTVHAERALARGACTLEVAFELPYNTRATSLYKVVTRGRGYLFTDFEPDDARGAWPCFDEPSFKIPWHVTVDVPKGQRAFSNTPPLSETAVGDRQRIVFRPTPPLPSYLVAVMAGPFETVPILGMSIPGHVVTVMDNARLGARAAQDTPPIVAALERYFGQGYPFEKLDLIAVPEFSAGAMENAAAITFRENRLLLDPATMSGQQRKSMISTTAHELAHMWFGDLVTLAWWNDLWLNESFASWMGDKITAEVAPEYHIEVDEVTDALRAMATDSRLTTRAIREHQAGTDNLSGLFDVLSYQKGQAVLSMLEGWLKPPVFRAGVRAYLTAHAHGNATAEDLWKALSKAAGRDVGAVAGSFLEQPGVPLVTVEPLLGAKARLTQRRFLNAGLEDPEPRLWKIPVTLRYKIGDHLFTQDVLLSAASQVVDLQSDGVPVWIQPNADERGYYHWSVPSTMLAPLAEGVRQVGSPRERVGFLGNLRALLDAGQIDGATYLDELERFSGDRDPQVVAAVVTAITALRHPFVTLETRDAFAAWVRRTMWPVLSRFGMAPSKGEPPTLSLMRPQLMQLLGDDGRDPRVLSWARQAEQSFMKDPTTVDRSLQDVAINLAAVEGDEALFDGYRARFEASHVPTERARFLTGLASFTDPARADRALQYAIEGSLRPQEIMTIANGLGAHPELRDRVFEWTLAHYDFIASHVPPSAVATLPRQAGGCSLERVAKAREFFSQDGHHPVGTTKELERMEAEVRDCVSLHDREGGTVGGYWARVARAK